VFNPCVGAFEVKARGDFFVGLIDSIFQLDQIGFAQYVKRRHCLLLFLDIRIVAVAPPPTILLPMKFLENHDLQRLNTFGLPARARWFCEVHTLPDLQAALADARFAKAPRQLILGGGSNLIFTADFDGCVIAPRLPGLAPVGETADAWLLEAGAGEPWHDTVARLLAMGRPGLENLALIPGTVGAAPIQNIGAYGLELKERFAWLNALEIATGKTAQFDLAACQFGYRDSVFKHAAAGKYVITSVTFALPKRWQPVTGYADVTRALEQRAVASPTPQDVFDVVVAVRSAKLPDPAVIGNVGSFFKNPVVSSGEAARLKTMYETLPVYPQAQGTAKLAAAWLIDQCGFKGALRGGVGVHDKQALVLVNRGGATGAGVVVLADEIRAAVHKRFGVALEPEPQIL
jgi:UDP-N-acetylmuramate dehydrogenase